MKKGNEMKEIKLKECPCCGGEAEMKEICYINATPSAVKVLCKKCELQTKTFTESLDYCAKEEVAEAWNERYTETNQGAFGGITVDKLERALEESMKEFDVLKKKGEVKRRKIPKCPICGHRSYNLREINSDSLNTYVLMVCKNCDTEIRTNEKKIDNFLWKDWYKMLKNTIYF